MKRENFALLVFFMNIGNGVFVYLYGGYNMYMYFRIKPIGPPKSQS